MHPKKAMHPIATASSPGTTPAAMCHLLSDLIFACALFTQDYDSIGIDGIREDGQAEWGWEGVGASTTFGGFGPR